MWHPAVHDPLWADKSYSNILNYGTSKVASREDHNFRNCFCNSTWYWLPMHVSICHVENKVFVVWTVIYRRPTYYHSELYPSLWVTDHVSHEHKNIERIIVA
jgi:hypothetical protein